jgi:hypothetical protein
MDPLRSIRFLAGLKEADPSDSLPAEPYNQIEKQTPGFASDTGMMPDHIVGDDPSYPGYAARQEKREIDAPDANKLPKDPKVDYVSKPYYGDERDNDPGMVPPGMATSPSGRTVGQGFGAKPVTAYEPGDGGGEKGGSDAGASGASAGKKAVKPSTEPDSQPVTFDFIPADEVPNLKNIDSKIAAQQQAEPSKPAPAQPPAAGTNVPQPPVIGTPEPSTWQLPSAGTPNAAPATSNTLTVHPEPQEKPSEPEPAKPAINMVKPEPSMRDLLNKLDKPKPPEPPTNIQPAPLTRSSPSQLVIPPQEKPPEPKTNMVPTLPAKPQFVIPPQQQTPPPVEQPKPATPALTRNAPSTLNLPSNTPAGDPRGNQDTGQGADKDDGAVNGFGPSGKDSGSSIAGDRYGRKKGPLTSPGPDSGPGPDETDGPNRNKKSRGYADHYWVRFSDPITGQEVDNPQNHAMMGSGFMRIGPGAYVSRLPMTHPDFNKLDLRHPNATPGETPDWARRSTEESRDIDDILRLSGQKRLSEAGKEDWSTQKPVAAQPAPAAPKTTPEPGSVDDIEQGRRDQEASNAKDVGKQVMLPAQQTQGRQQMQQPGSDIDGDIVSVGPEYLKPRYASPQAAPYYPTPPRQIIMPNRPMYPGQQHRMWAGPQTRGPQYRYDYRGPRSR